MKRPYLLLLSARCYVISLDASVEPRVATHIRLRV